MELKGMNNCMAAICYFEAQVVNSLLHNCESWIGVTEEHIQQLQELKNKLIRRVLEAPLQRWSRIRHKFVS